MGERLRRMVPPTPALRVYAACMLVDSVGVGLYSTGSVLFFTRRLHFSASFVGLALTVAALGGLVVSVPAGRLSDRVGRKAIFTPSYAVLGGLFCGLVFARSKPVFLAVLLSIAVAENAARPARSAALSDLVDGAERVAAAAYSRAVTNAGFSLGAVGAAAALAVGSPTAYDALLIGNGASFVVTAALFARLRLGQPRAREHADVLHRSVFADARFLALAACTGVLLASEDLIDVGVPLIVGRRAAPGWLVPATLLVNTVMVVILQVRFSRGTEDVRVAARTTAVAGVALLAACLVLPISDRGGTAVVAIVLLTAMVPLTLGELWLSAGQWGMSFGLAPPGRQGEYLAAYGMVSQAVTVAGPVLAAVVVVHGLVAWLGAGLVFLLAGLVAPLLLSGMPTSTPPSPRSTGCGTS